MKTLTHPFSFLLLFACGLLSCTQNSAPEITNLSVSKATNIVFSDNITVRVTAKDKDDDPIVYTWEATDGTISGSGNEVTWRPPSKVGKYTLTSIVSDGEKTVTQTKSVNVVGSYYYSFSEVSSAWTKSSNTTAYFQYNNGIASVYSSNTTNSGALLYTPGTPINPPYSIKTKIAVNLPDVTTGTTSWVSLCYCFNNPGTGRDYLSKIYFAISTNADSWVLGADIYNVATSSIIDQNITSDSYATRKIFTENNQFHTVGMAITQDKTLVINIDGVELYRTTALATEAAYNRDLTLSGLAYFVNPGLTLYVDDFCLAPDGTIIK